MMVPAQNGSQVSNGGSQLSKVRNLFAKPSSVVANDPSVARDASATLQPVSTQPAPTPNLQNQALDVADSVISRVLAQRTQALEAEESAQAAASAGQKEREASMSPDNTQVESASGIQVVEQERQPELPPEVDGFLQHVDSHVDQAPAEIVLNDLSEDNLPKNLPKQSVIVVPITPEIEEEGAKKNSTFSVRWLVEWSQKLIKMFQGKVVYRQVEE